MRIDGSHLDQFQEQGFTLVRNLIPPDVVDAVARRSREVARDHPAWAERSFQWLDPGRYQWEDGTLMPAGIQRPGVHESVFRSMCEHPALQAAMAALLGGPVVLSTDQVLWKWGRITEDQAGRTFYHQDSYYWRIAPKLGCNVWIPFQPVDRDVIALAILPGSQREWTLLDHERYFDDPPLCRRDGTPFERHRVPSDRLDLSGEVLVPMEPGDGLFFTNFTLHRSEPNRTGADLGAYAIAYRLAEAGAS